MLLQVYLSHGTSALINHGQGFSVLLITQYDISVQCRKNLGAPDLSAEHMLGKLTLNMNGVIRIDSDSDRGK